MPALFDMRLRAERRDRAARSVGDRFLLERAFADCVERIELVQRRFGTALLIGCPDANWPRRLSAVADQVRVVDPGRLFAAAAKGGVVIEDRIVARADAFDLILAIGTLDTIDDLPAALRALAGSLSADGLMIGAMSGGETVPVLRAAMRAADRLDNVARAHVHPRIEPSALVHLLTDAGLVRPVVDVDRVRVAYPSFQRLVGDMRAMAATNILIERPRQPLSRAAFAAAGAAFDKQRQNGKTIETFELLHFAGWRVGSTATTDAARPR